MLGVTLITMKTMKVHEGLSPGSEGLSYAWVRIQLGPAAHASQCLTVFAASGPVFQTKSVFEHIPFLAHALDACAAIGTYERITQQRASLRALRFFRGL